MILNKDGEVEREYVHEDFEKENSLFDVEDDMEDEEPDENNLRIEDIDVIADMDEEED